MQSLFESHDLKQCGTLASQTLTSPSKDKVTQIGPESCLKCFGAAFFIKEGDHGIEASPCTCIDALSQDGYGWERISRLRERSDYVSSSRIPNRYIKALNSKNISLEATKWLESYLAGVEDQPNFLFFYGDVGTGKTHTAAFLLLEILKSGLNKSVLYLPVYEFIEWREQYLSLRYSRDKSEKDHAIRRYNRVLEQIRIRDVVVLDELGQEKLNPDERKLIFKLLDDRYNNNKATILISNHCDNKDLTLEGKLLKSLVGTRISSRLKSAREIYFRGADRRAQEGGAVFTQAEIENFIVPAKIQTHDENTHQIMTWLARNPAFETISSQDRQRLTGNRNGVAFDLDRPSPSFYQDVWIPGDTLQVSGPICDHEDKKLYALLIKELANSHRAKRSGLTISTSYHEIIRLLGLASCGDAFHKVKRQLNRLLRMSLSFKNADGKKWSGPLITEVFESAGDSEAKLVIMFSHFMIAFYNAHAYTTFDHRLSSKLMGDRSAFYLFFASHVTNRTLYPVPFEKCRKLLAMPESISRKAALRRISLATKDLIKFKVLGEGTRFLKNSLYPVAGPAIN